MKNINKFLIAIFLPMMLIILVAFSKQKAQNVIIKEITSNDTTLVDSLTIHEKIYYYLTDELKLSRSKALGLIANAERESGLKTVISNSNGTTNGLFQWNGQRLKLLKENVPDWGENWKAQFQYALEEDVGPKYLMEVFKNPQEAAQWWAKFWERPHNLNAATIKNNQLLKSYNF